MPDIVSNSLAKLPPQNIEAEQSLIGAILIDKDAIIKIADMLSPNDFYREAHAALYGTILELFEKKEAIDILSLTSRLEEKKKLEAIGGRSYLVTLTNQTPSAAHVVSYAQIIQKKATLRRLISAANNILELGYHEEKEVNDILDKAEQSVFAVSQQFLKEKFIPIQDVLSAAFDRIDQLHREKGKLRGLPTGYSDLDNLLAGFQKSDLIVLAARPSVGKTSLALDIARHVAIKAKKSIGIFSLEMSKEQLVDRLICAQAGVGLWKMRTGRLSETTDDFPKIGQAMSELSESRIYIDDFANTNVMELRTKARRLQMEHGLDMVIIDYLQLMEGSGRKSSFENRVQEIAEISRALKGLARELDIPVLALSQLSRAVEQASPAIPKLSHLRESGSIEQDADVVMFIYRKAADRSFDINSLTEEEKNSAEIYIAKHRNGPTGQVKLYFQSDLVSFRTLETKRQVTENPEM
ncbi:MAG: replicative DNA helicase [Candidatus Buchananbacteria bacterium RIFCSPHIGHO2_02_FULL_40_13]|uniref:Replicative DNA helicase n=1 Tax=Candidatus Buchananbacteria bacterium RIFCSPLOWO2_01_FULL_39_33 TaxID=1797543 RepID=A0A1G1YNT4_9BACT|nr:MAG: replicative DNA helicase [Candidatus Buchananbacteria bacterium RIFCSPHIGHO2_01_FULL_40_35]OGY50115.1 MAG: replicative DNA helicase [Candidatus Buchananbacteria bacterium RIFCSPHIGHO2_02_FULL_40_13]OGY53097.1 MAG: replicative DNA helicase [Candidatus Buchananbacteria bacterium RIFCSPLOWO2_01_FULL_39_33]